MFSSPTYLTDPAHRENLTSDNYNTLGYNGTAYIIPDVNTFATEMYDGTTTHLLEKNTDIQTAWNLYTAAKLAASSVNDWSSIYNKLIKAEKYY